MYQYTSLFQHFSIPDLQEKMQKANSIVITSHKSPDGDAVGSSLGLWNCLQQAGIKSKVVLPDAFPKNLQWMNGSEKVIFFDSQKSEATSLIQNADILFSLDYNDFSRVGNELGELMRSSKSYKIMIDHHPDPTSETDILISSTAECATAQMIFQFIVAMGWKPFLNVKAAECIYCGIMTDSGSFRFSSTTPKTHAIVAELLSAGLSHVYVHSQVFDNDSESRLKLLGFTLSEKMRVLHEHKTTYFILTKNELQQFNYHAGDTEGFVNYGLAVEGIQMAAIIIERDDQIKFSFRSKGTVPVNLFSKSYFNGGGHTNAAGGSLKCNLNEAESLFLEKLPEFIKQHAK
jgi:phosphoesterase RecJ-like protein